MGYFLPDFDYMADSDEDWIPYLETEGYTSSGIVTLLQQDHQVLRGGDPSFERWGGAAPLLSFTSFAWLKKNTYV